MERCRWPLGAPAFERSSSFPAARPLAHICCPRLIQNASIDRDTVADADAAADAARRAVAALRQAACDLCAPLAPASLLLPDQINLVRFHFKVCAVSAEEKGLCWAMGSGAMSGQLSSRHYPFSCARLQAGHSWAALGEPEAAEAALSKAAAAVQPLLPLALERRGRGAQHQEAAALAFQLMLERLGVALQLKQDVGAGGWRQGGSAVVACRLAAMLRRSLTASHCPQSSAAMPPPVCRCWWAAC